MPLSVQYFWMQPKTDFWKTYMKPDHDVCKAFQVQCHGKYTSLYHPFIWAVPLEINTGGHFCSTISDLHENFMVNNFSFIYQIIISVQGLNHNILGKKEIDRTEIVLKI